MVPPSSSAAAAGAGPTPRRAAPATRPGREARRDAPDLRVVPVRRAGALRRRLVSILPVAMVVGALLAVVVAQALLANGQVRLAGVDKALQTEQGVHRQAELLVAMAETPPRIVGAATSHGMVRATITELPYVSLTTPIALPKVTPPPAASTATTSTASSSTVPVTTTTLAPAR
jgi:hypothetical protein